MHTSQTINELLGHQGETYYYIRGGWAIRKFEDGEYGLVSPHGDKVAFFDHTEVRKYIDEVNSGEFDS